MRLWSPGNLHALPGGDWHFCVAPRQTTERSEPSNGEEFSSPLAVEPLTSMKFTETGWTLS
jgi:hypothetical protein